jgi:hypothetical protein
MGTEREKGRWKGMDPNEPIEAALKDGLSEDRSGIDSNPVHRELAPSSKLRHAAMIEVWKACVVNRPLLYCRLTLRFSPSSLRKPPADDLATTVATPGRKLYPWKNDPRWSKLYNKLHPPKNSTGSVETDNLQSPDQTEPIASTGEAHLSIARSSEQTLALMTISASSLSDVGEDGSAIVDVSKLTAAKILDKRSSSSGVEYKCELEPL